jgi:O-antigen/teichoic acid export membrane protein
MAAPEDNTEDGGLLLWLSRYTKTDLTYLASGGFWLALDQIAGGLAALALSIAFAHYVPKDAYGTYRFLLAIFWTLTALTMTGLPTAVAQAVARGYEGTFRASLSWSVLWGLPLLLTALCGAGYYALAGDRSLAIGLIIIALCGPCMQAAYLFGSYLSGKKAFKTVAYWSAIFAVAPALALGIAMLFTKDPLIFTLIYFIATLLTGFLLTLWTLAKFKPNKNIDPGFRNTGGHFSAMNLLSTLAAQLDKLVVFHYLGAFELATYAFATAIPEQIRGLFGNISVLALPKFVERSFKDIVRNFWTRVWLLTGVLIAVTFSYIVIAPYVFHLFFPQYAESIWYSQLYALALIPIGGALPVTLLQAHEAKRELYILNIFSPLFQIGALVILTASYGLTGTIIARILGRTTSFLLGGILIQVYGNRTLS